MKGIFNSIKENMDETVMKDIHFNEVNKEKVLQAVIKKRVKHRFKKRPSLSYLLSVSAACMFFIGIAYFISDELGFLQQEEQMASLNNDQSKKNLFIPADKEELYVEMTKDEVTEKLLNSVDYFDTAAGSIELYKTYPDGRSITTITEFKVSTQKIIGGYEKTTEEVRDGGESITEVIYNDGKIWRKESAGKSYRVCGYKPLSSQEQYTSSQEAFSVEIKDLYKPNTKLRERPLPGSKSGETLFPYEMAASYLRNEQLWKIEKQNDEIAGHNTVVIYGKHDDTMKEWTEDDAFRFWVDKDTGILVQYETYDKNGKLTSYLHPKRLEVNVPIGHNDFVPILDGYHDTQSPCLSGS